MQVKKGQSRLVLLVPCLGIAVKLPRVYFYKGIRLVLGLDVLLGKKGEGSRSQWDIDFALQQYFFRGLASNFREFFFYIGTHNPFLQPTYFSLFGIINFQRLGEPCGLHHKDLDDQLRELTGGGIGGDHHFNNPANFCLEGGRLRIHDYDSRETQEIIRRYGAIIYEFFDPARYRTGPGENT